MPITKEQIEQALTEDPATANLLADVLKSREFQVLPKTDYDKFINDERGRISGEVIRTYLTPIDEALASLGLTKTGDEKTGDYAKRVAAHAKTELDKSTQALAALTEKYKDGADEATRKLITDATTKLKQTETELAASRKENHKLTVLGSIEKGLAGLKFSGAVPESVREAYVQTQIAALLAVADFENGGLVFKDAEGKVIIGAGGQPATAASLLKDRLKDVLDTGRQQPGTGTTPPGTDPGTPPPGADGADPGTPPGTVASKMALASWLNERGFVAGSAEYTKYFAKYSKDANGKELPLR